MENSPDNSLVSVVIPCYNQGKYVNEAVDSVLNQTYENIEIIIVNDGSTDTFTNNLLSAYDRPKTKIITTKNQGLSEARNTGIRHAKGKYILPLDADDKIAENYCQEAVDKLAANDSLSIVYCDAEYFGDKTGPIKLPDYSLEMILKRNLIFCSAFFRFQDWEATSGYNSNMIYGNEDWDFWLSLIERGAKVYKIPKPYFFYRIKTNSMLKNLVKDEKKRYHTRKQIYLNHLELYANHFEDPINLYYTLKKVEDKYNRLTNLFFYKLAFLLYRPIRYFKYIINKSR